MKTILIGVPVLDNAEMLRVCLQHMDQYTGSKGSELNVEVLILDNGSQEDIAGLLSDDFQSPQFRIHYLKNSRNMGVAIAWNQILRFSPEKIAGEGFHYGYYVIVNSDAFVGPDWLLPLVEAMESDQRIGWVSSMENGSPVSDMLLEAHALTRQYRVDPSQPYTSKAFTESMTKVYGKWGGYASFCARVKSLGLPLFIPFHKAGRSAVCFMVRPAMIEQIGFFDEDFAPVGIAEDLEYFLRMDRLLTPSWLTEDRYPENAKWKSGFCGKSIVHHNWCSTRQGPNFNGRKWDKAREKNWRAKFGKSKKYYTGLFS